MAVYVYIYGGVFTIGSNSQSVFDGHYMAYDNGNKDMVVVNVNYRLHALGFMALHSTQTQALNYADEPLYYQVNPTSVEFPTITTTRTE
jgi:carboxylesterase type B